MDAHLGQFYFDRAKNRFSLWRHPTPRIALVGSTQSRGAEGLRTFGTDLHTKDVPMVPPPAVVMERWR